MTKLTIVITSNIAQQEDHAATLYSTGIYSCYRWSLQPENNIDWRPGPPGVRFDYTPGVMKYRLSEYKTHGLLERHRKKLLNTAKSEDTGIQ